MAALRVGYVPEHFSTPLQFAQQHGFFAQQGLEVQLVPFPSGTGHMIASLNANELDIAIGLTEAFVRGQLTTETPSYKIVSTYVSSPLNWAVSTGAHRDDLTNISQLDGATIGVSRVGSGSYVMSYVMALEQGFKGDPPFASWPVCNTFQGLRDAVNDGTCDAFMWEYFTTRAYYNGKDLKLLGNILTPWSSWVIVQSTSLEDATMNKFLEAVRDGVAYFKGHIDEAIEYISTALPYSESDARDWLPTVTFDVASPRDAVDQAEKLLRVAGCL